MQDTKKEQLVWLIFGFLFVAGMLFFVEDSAVVISLSVTFTSIVGIFLGIDIAVMIKKTSALPEGQFKEINKQRYIISLVIFGLLIAEAIYLSAAQGRNADALYASFGMGFLIVIGGLITGIEGNKIVTAAKE